MDNVLRLSLIISFIYTLSTGPKLVMKNRDEIFSEVEGSLNEETVVSSYEFDYLK